MSGQETGTEPDEDLAQYIGDEDEDEELQPGQLGRMVRFLRPYFKPYARTLWAVGGLLLLQTILNASFPIATRYLIDDGLVERNWDALVTVLIFLGFAALAVSLVAILNDYLFARLAANVVKDLRGALFEHIQRLPMPYFQRTASGQLLSRFSGDIVATETLLVHLVTGLMMPLLEVIYATALMFYFNVWLGLIGLSVFPMILLGPRLFSGRAFGLSYEKRSREADLLSAAHENVTAQPVVQAFGLQAQAISRYRHRNLEWVRYAFRMNFFAGLAESSAYMGVYVIHVVIVGLGAYWAYSDVISIGTLVAFEAMFISMGYALTDVSQFIPTLAQAAGSVQHLEEVFDEPRSISDAPGARVAPRMESSLRVENVSFAYPDGRQALQDVSFAVGKNSYVALVGRSGSGKSTLLSLLLRFYDPTAGRLTLDGVDLREITQDSLRSQIGIVFQDSFLFNASIIDNVRVGKADATPDEVRAALQSAEIWEAVQALPAGLETIVGERGGRLSGGQRQRIAIARALVRDPEILILDEATSALDAVAEAAINITLERVARSRTVINVTHRLSNVTGADRIVLLQDGRIVATGDHPTLLAAHGAYAALWRAQQRDA
ncbi:MAG TPA: ABC transporter ATP-binding protein [Xanthobacteraceae bacterium]|nr:ABC transporter ATP-binding protein [Xanthobacteraceae bacterium]